VPDATQLLQPFLDWTSNRALRRATLVDNPGAALRFSVRLNLCIHATLGDLEALNLLRGGKSVASNNATQTMARFVRSPDALSAISVP